jgi:hypothetical protein
VKKVKVVGTEGWAKRTFRRIGIAVIHVTSFLKGRRSVADGLEKPDLPGKKRQ